MDGSATFIVPYFEPKWRWGFPPPIQHANGVTLSFADGHAEYWKWRAETARIPRQLKEVGPGWFVEQIESTANYQPQTEDGLYDLQRTQRAAWGRLGYSNEASATESPPDAPGPAEGRR
jgi:prepilin-type processing-associated H-X9-DG protein